MWSKVGGCPTLTPPQSPNPECMAVNMCTHTLTLRGTLPLLSRSQKTVRRKNKMKGGEKF